MFYVFIFEIKIITFHIIKPSYSAFIMYLYTGFTDVYTATLVLCKPNV